MTWNYRIIKRADPATGGVNFQIHEVYYNNAEEVVSITEAPVSAFGETPEELIRDLEHMLSDAKNHPVLEFDKIAFAQMND